MLRWVAAARFRSSLFWPDDELGRGCPRPEVHDPLGIVPEGAVTFHISDPASVPAKSLNERELANASRKVGAIFQDYTHGVFQSD